MLLAACSAAGFADESVPAAIFSSLAVGATFPSDWKELTVDNKRARTNYQLVQDAGVTVLRGQASASASAMSRTVQIDPQTFPVLRWRWNVANLIERSDLRRKSGDDFPARLYVFFDYDISRLPFSQRVKLGLARALYGDAMPVAALCYVWDRRSPKGTIAPNAYTDRVAMVVVETGPARLGQWVELERNVLADFKAAFGEDAPPISGIAMAVDTDDTGARATTLFGDASFHRSGSTVPGLR